MKPHPPLPSKRPLSRRGLLAAAGGAALLATLPLSRAGASAPGALPDLAPLPPGAPDRTLFAPAEQRYAPYLVTLAPMVDDMDDDGFFAGGWWRSPAASYNARVQEHVYTLSWFYANARRWNPYAGDSALLAALDAGLGHYLGLQHDDGSWPEYSIGEHSMPATGFAMGYLSKTLAILRKAHVLSERQAQIRTALRSAMTWFLDPATTAIWQTPLAYANQATAGLAGASLALNLDPDAFLRRRLTDAIARLARTGQSPAGFFYEQRGMDMNYNFEVMLPETADAYHQTGDKTFVSMAHAFADWLGYNLVREPDGSGYIANIAPSTRTSSRYYDDIRPDPDRTALNWTFVREVPELGAFLTAREDLAAARAAWAADPAPVPPLRKQDTSPRILTHAIYGESFPTRKERKKAVADLPYLKKTHFVELRSDLGQDFLYVRRPGLYLGGYFGTRATTRTRTGLTFLWHPAAGMVVHSLNDSNEGCWATVLSNGNPDAAANQPAEYFDGEPGGPAWTGRHSTGEGTFGIRYHTASSSIRTDVVITRDTVRRSVRATSAATEQIPLILHPTDAVTFTDGTRARYGADTGATATGLDLRRGNVLIAIRWGTARPATLQHGASTYFRDGERLIHVLRIPHEGRLDTAIKLA
ncbi:hypothetical protein OG417_40525 [Actinoallomurus sp. NBC_01490]|uniref:hypothetical protein n=1 Tax=Actinoallomurus sp. NBC_01490 TaxID=2903557 RepID=UPI002E374C2B|nr:hypothetical protein [Actinoallomurus sp. NBC_01490]